jgi:hypothetical protein
MVEPELRDSADGGGGDDVGRVEPPAEADLDHAGVGGGAGESEEGGGGRYFEEGRRYALGGIEHFLQQGGEILVLDELAGEPDPLVEADQVRAREDMRRKACRFDGGAQESAGRSLAVGPGDVEDRGHAALGMAEASEQGRHPLQAEHVAARRKAGESIQLPLHSGLSDMAKSASVSVTLNLFQGPCLPQRVLVDGAETSSA